VRGKSQQRSAVASTRRCGQSAAVAFALIVHSCVAAQAWAQIQIQPKYINKRQKSGRPNKSLASASTKYLRGKSVATLAMPPGSLCFSVGVAVTGSWTWTGTWTGVAPVTVPPVPATSKKEAEPSKRPAPVNFVAGCACFCCTSYNECEEDIIFVLRISYVGGWILFHLRID